MAPRVTATARTARSTSATATPAAARSSWSRIAFFTALAESGEAAPKLATLSSTTFDAQLAVESKVAHDNPDLYFEIQTLNDYGTESLAALLYAVERLRLPEHPVTVTPRPTTASRTHRSWLSPPTAGCARRTCRRGSGHPI
jgi:hypothetical protein